MMAMAGDRLARRVGPTDGRQLLAATAKISVLSPLGSKQLAADIAYLENILSASAARPMLV